MDRKQQIDVYHPVTNARASKVNDVKREPAIRLYCTTHRQSWALQVRGPMQLNDTRIGKDFIVASANLSAEDLKVLRDAIDAALETI